MDMLRRDLLFAFRSLIRKPGFALVAILTIALGVGANTAVFSLLYGLVLRPLPYPDADRLVIVASNVTDAKNFGDWESSAHTVDRMAAYSLGGITITGHGPARQVGIMGVSKDFMRILGGSVELGRGWTDADHAPGARPTALITRRLLDRIAPGVRTTQGLTVTVRDVVHDVVGVIPAGFSPLKYDDTDVFVPLRSWGRHVNIVARLAPGVTLDAAAKELNGIAGRLPQDEPGTPNFANLQTVDDLFIGDLRREILILFAAAVLVLLNACVNVANLLLSRGTERRAELAVRGALGASRVALLRQLLVESLSIAVLGGIAGIVIAWWGTRMLVRLSPGGISRIDEVGINLVVLAFGIAVAVIATVGAGLMPALLSTRGATLHGATLNGATLHGARTTGGRVIGRWRDVLVAGETALALVLLVGTLLLVRTFTAIRPHDTGFDIAARTVVSVELPADAAATGAAPALQNARTTASTTRMLQEFERTFGGDVALVSDAPLTGNISSHPVKAIDGTAVVAREGAKPPRIDVLSTSPNYFSVMGMRVENGRTLATSDIAGATPAIVINRTAARKLWPDGRDPIGRRIKIDMYDAETEFTVVGVAADTRTQGMRNKLRAEAFVSFAQAPTSYFQVIVHAPRLRIGEDAVRQVVASVEPAAPVTDVTTLAAIAGEAVATERFQATLMGAYGVLATLLAVIGCYSILAYSVEQRRRELGVRLALGATSSAIMRQVLARGSMPVIAGIAVGTGVALASVKVLASLLFGVKPLDPTSFATAILLLGSVSILAAAIPARRAAITQPLEVLRSGD